MLKDEQNIMAKIQDDVFDAILNYPIALLFSDLILDVPYTVDFLNQTALPIIKEKPMLFKPLFEWFDQSVPKNYINAADISKCLLKVKVCNAKFLFVKYKKYLFTLCIESPHNKLIKMHSVNGWL